MSASSATPARALFAASESTLSVDEAVELVTIIFQNHSQPKIKPMESFQHFARTLSDRIYVETHNVWSQRMKEAVGVMEFTIPIVRQDFNDDLRLKAFTTILALSFALSKSSTLDLFRRKSEEIVNSNRSPFTLSAVGKTMLGTYMSALMMFWLCYDQLDIEDETRSLIKAFFSSASERFLLTDKPSFLWMTQVIVAKFDKKIRTILADRGIVVAEDNEDGETTLKILSD